jgi:hypothetical protein
LPSRTDTATEAASSSVRPAYSAFGTGVFDGVGLGVAVGFVVRAVVGVAETDDDGDASRFGDDTVFDPDVALSVNMNRPNNRPARSVSSGPGRFTVALPRGVLPAHESGLVAVGKEA